jgi:signal-transduction protein with cAMP-binding, CBS, and nucleotidyltransferase domain
MASMKIVEALQQVAIFRGLEPSQLEALARHTERIKFAPGDFITRAGEAGTGAYLLVSGAAECLPEPGLQDAPEVVHPGSFIGQLSMLIEHAYGSSVVARERAYCLRITRAGIHAQMVADPALAAHFERHVTQHLGAVARQLREIDSLLQARRNSLGQPPPALAPPQAQVTLGAAAHAS